MISEEPRYPISQEYFKRLKDRRLFKKVYECSVDDFKNPVLRDRIVGQDKGLYAKLRKEVAIALKEPEEFILVRFIGIKDPTFRAPGQRLSPEEVMVKTKNGLECFKDVPYLLTHKNTTQSALEYVHVYARRDHWEGLTPEEKAKEYEKDKQSIDSIVKQYVEENNDNSA